MAFQPLCQHKELITEVDMYCMMQVPLFGIGNERCGWHVWPDTTPSQQHTDKSHNLGWHIACFPLYTQVHSITEEENRKVKCSKLKWSPNKCILADSSLKHLTLLSKQQFITDQKHFSDRLHWLGNQNVNYYCIIVLHSWSAGFLPAFNKNKR